jgi:hypothetical protein
MPEAIASILREGRLLTHSRAIDLYDEDPPVRYHDRLPVTNERPLRQPRERHKGVEGKLETTKRKAAARSNDDALAFRRLNAGRKKGPKSALNNTLRSPERC